MWYKAIDFGERLRALNVVDVGRQFIEEFEWKPWRKEGRFFYADCFFHKSEDMPMRFNPVSNYFYCYGCRMGGGPIYLAFLTLEDPIGYLCEKAGFDPSDEDQMEVLRNELMKELCKSDMLFESDDGSYHCNGYVDEGYLISQIVESGEIKVLID